MAATPRLTFLYPALFRSASSQTKATHHVSKEFRDFLRAGYRTTCRKQQQDEVRSRYGTANEPPPHITSTSQLTQQNAPRKSPSSKPEIAASLGPEKPALPKPQDKATAEKRKGKDVDSSPDHPALEKSAKDSAQEGGAPEEIPTPSPEEPQNTTHAEQPVTAIKPLETVLHMEPPSSTRQENKRHKPPHLVTPPYVHHFDTYTLVRNLEEGGFSQEQAVTCMKAVRSLLAFNMDLARAGLVSKSDVENESYLFKAACSELKTEIQNKRRHEVETMRAARTQLQHEFDILSQRVGQEAAGLKDELKGMFDDRKMGVRMEQRAMESMIQQLNYKITVALNSDSRSEVEGLRWILTRRAGMAIIIAAVMMLGGASYISRQEAEEKERKKKKIVGGPTKASGDARDEGASPRNSPDGSHEGTGGAGDTLADLSAKEGVGPGYVSLG